MTDRPTLDAYAKVRERIAGQFVPTSRPGDAQVTVRLPETDMLALRAKALKSGKTISDLVRLAVKRDLQ
jgi:predicted DNA binding CopG/RHH family protein